MSEAFIMGVGMTRFSKHLDRSIKSLTQEAVTEALQDASVSNDSLEAAWFSNSGWGYYTGQHSIRGQVALRPCGIEQIPITNVENACASASTGLYSACMAIKAGQHDCVLVIGAEKMYHEDREKMFRAFFMGVDVENMDEQIALFQSLGEELSLTEEQRSMGGKAGQDKSVFMDAYAGMARNHAARYNSTQRQLAVIASKNHFHSSMNPLAQYQNDMSVEEILVARVVSFPLTVPMCAPVGDGAAAAVICSKSFLKKHPNPRAVRIRASVLGSGSSRTKDEDDQDIGKRLSKQAYEIAQVGPADIDLAEVHDATAYGELHQYEALGFCHFGEGGAFAESGATTIGGKLPVNTSGGLESRGHPIGASGLGQVHELVTQLRGEAGQRQVEGARLALAENGGGIIGFEEAAMAVHILEKASP
jgi:acetyl-CoA acetyltransferase